MSSRAIYRRGGKILRNGRRSKGDFARRLSHAANELRDDRERRERTRKLDWLIQIDKLRKAAASEGQAAA